jgi:hypothetical protein
MKLPQFTITRDVLSKKAVQSYGFYPNKTRNNSKNTEKEYYNLRESIYFPTFALSETKFAQEEVV